jgi:hypothetical protein
MADILEFVASVIVEFALGLDDGHRFDVSLTFGVGSSGNHSQKSGENQLEITISKKIQFSTRLIYIIVQFPRNLNLKIL